MPTIYLSPSMQEYNPYITDGNEEEVMNQVADALVPYLRTNGVQYTRNTPDMNVLQAIEQSNNGNYDLHVAIHSNASPENMSGQLQGTVVYYRPGNRSSRLLADILVRNFKDIYPYPWMVRAEPSSYLAEVRRTIAPAVLIETAYHDNYEDARWIHDNIDNIARAIALSIMEYFGLPFLEPQPVREGRVTTGGPNLLLRTRPNTGAPIILRMPDGARVTVYGILPNGWYVVRYGGRTGYASGNYITLDS